MAGKEGDPGGGQGGGGRRSPPRRGDEEEVDAIAGIKDSCAGYFRRSGARDVCPHRWRTMAEVELGKRLELLDIAGSPNARRTEKDLGTFLSAV